MEKNERKKFGRKVDTIALAMRSSVNFTEVVSHSSLRQKEGPTNTRPEIRATMRRIDLFMVIDVQSVMGELTKGGTEEYHNVLTIGLGELHRKGEPCFVHYGFNKFRCFPAH